MSQHLRRWSELAAMLGGVIWAAWAVMVAGKPEGCVEEACNLPGRSTRGDSDFSPLLGAAALLIAVGVIGMVMLAHSMETSGSWAGWSWVLWTTRTQRPARLTSIQ